MRILLVHPEDLPDRGPWLNQTWDRVVDLGRGGEHAYERWSRRFRCPAAPLEPLRLEEFQSVRALLEAGLGRLRDEEDLDWWELTAIFFHQQMEILTVLRRFAAGIGSADEVFVTRPGFYADALAPLLGSRVHCFSTRFSSQKRGALHYSGVLWKFPLPQLVEIFWDKYDPGYVIRAPLSRRREASSQPVVLLPSAYENVSRMGIAYANTLPETNFLLVATRRSGWLPAPPANVSVARLASYAGRRKATRHEYSEILKKWRDLRLELEHTPEIAILSRLRLLDSVPRLLRQGLAIRDAWRAVFETEPVKAVLCGDDSNPYTRIPLLLGRQRGIPTIACHHGAFDGRYLIKRNHADIILAKGRMEEDYLLRVCGLPPDSVEIGAPGRPPSSSPRKIGNSDRGGFIVFFSERYEVSFGRAEEFYRDLLPPLADLAMKTDRKLVVKLHPFESQRERSRLVARILSREQRQVTALVSGPLTDDLLQKTWFSVTILSTVAMECALLGIPCFLGGWLEYWPYGYVQQYSRFDVGYLLKSAAEILEIPRILESYSVKPEPERDLWQPISAVRFQELLSRERKLDSALAR